MQRDNSYKHIILSLSLLAIAFFNVSSQAWDSFWIANTEWRISGIFTVLSSWGIPVFIASIGLFFLSDESQISTRYNLLKRVPRAILGCAIWWIVSSLVYLKYYHPNETDSDTFFECMSKVLETPFNIKLLQLVVLFFAFYPLLKRIAANEKMTKYAVIIFFAFSCVLPAIHFVPYLNYVNLFADQINWGFFTPFGLYLFIGLYLTKKEYEWHQRVVIYCVGVLSTVAMFACTVFLSAENIGYDTRFVVESSPFVALQSSAIIVLCKSIISKTKGLKRDAVFQNVAYAAYVFIPLFSITQNLMGYIVSFEKAPILLLIPAEALLCFACSICLSILIRKVPIISYFSI